METTEATPSTPTVQDRVREIFAAFEAHGAPGATTANRYLLHLEGSAIGVFLLEVDPSGARWKMGEGETAEVTIRIDTQDFIAIADGSIDGRLALASEKIELEGDMEAAAGLLRMFFPEEPEA